jgi:hypothetical protein
MTQDARTEGGDNDPRVRTEQHDQFGEHPLSQFAGIFDENDPIVQQWLEIIREQRERDEVY